MTFEDFDEFLNYKENLRCLRELKHKEKLYYEFKIRKRRGGFRSICAPIECLKRIQQELNEVLFNYYNANDEVHGYVKTKSIKSNAESHVGKNIILNLDIKNFFDSISVSRIIDLFISEPCKLDEKRANLYTDIVTYKNHLPQGAPTSPILSNMVCKNLDEKLTEYSENNGYTYTRYADDLTFSTNKQKISEEEILEIKEMIRSEKFIVNEKKVKLSRQSTHQQVTGLTVNEKLSVRRRYIRTIRAILHDWEINGIDEATTKYFDKYYKTRNTKCFIHSVRGKIGYIGWVMGKYDSVYLRYLMKYYKLLSKEGKNYHSHFY